MSLKGRLKRIQGQLPQKEKKDEQNELYEKVISWLVKHKHEEYIESLRKAWRISIKGEGATLQEQAEYDRLFLRINEIVKEYSRKELLM